MERQTSLAEAYPIEQERCRELLQIYNELPGGVGRFGALMINQTLAEADQALMSGDVVAMIRAYESMKELQ